MDIQFLGTSSGTPSRTRNVSGLALRGPGGGWSLVDCGEGTQHRILQTTLSLHDLRAIFIAHLPLIYLTAWIGTKQLPSYGGDYSYGVYLYSYPIQQMLVSISPSMREWWIVFPLSAALSLLVAAVSWTWIERPALGLKRYVHMLRPRPT